MALYPRSDFVSVFVPVASGGCGQPHIRPVVNGAPEKEWILVCPGCESHLRKDLAAAGFRKQRTVNEDAGMKLADRYPGTWGTTTDTVPETPDEEKRREHAEALSVTRNAASMTDAMVEMARQGADTSDLMKKLIEIQAALLIKDQNLPPLAPVLPVPADPPVINRYTADEAPCQDCGTVIHREPGQKGSLPWRCPACKASKTARRKVA